MQHSAGLTRMPAHKDGSAFEHRAECGRKIDHDFGRQGLAYVALKAITR